MMTTGGNLLALWALAALLLLACTADTRSMAEYYSSDRATMMLLDGERGYVGANPAAPEPVGDALHSYQLLQPLERHPLAGGACIAVQHFAFARRADMKEGDTFACGGVAFRVARCTAADANCSSFEMEAHCADFREGRCHSSRVPDHSLPSYTYGYEGGRGVTRVDFAPGEKDESGRLLLAAPTGMIL